jgi:ribosome assembly protein YihI (activator of Der GTPase)
MPRQKKSRKIGQIGTPKTTLNKRTPTEKRSRKPLGKPAGSRNNEALTANNGSGKKLSKDPRHGSKKPISLVAADKVKKTAPQVKYFSPATELEAIEKDAQLATLLGKLDLGKAITAEQQQYVDKTLSRHKELCDMLGLKDEEESPEPEQQSDPFSNFEAIDINDFKD